MRHHDHVSEGAPVVSLQPVHKWQPALMSFSGRCQDSGLNVLRYDVLRRRDLRGLPSPWGRQVDLASRVQRGG
jgi:hypothetical protein